MKFLSEKRSHRVTRDQVSRVSRGFVTTTAGYKASKRSRVRARSLAGQLYGLRAIVAAANRSATCDPIPWRVTVCILLLSSSSVCHLLSFFLFAKDTAVASEQT